jgi:SRR1
MSHRIKSNLDTFNIVLLGIHAPEKIVCLGLGSLSDGEAHRRRVSAEQLALLLELNELFKVQGSRYVLTTGSHSCMGSSLYDSRY